MTQRRHRGVDSKRPSRVLERCLGALEVAGGAVGIYSALGFMSLAGQLRTRELVIVVAGLAFYALSVAAGTLLLTRNAMGVTMSLIVQALQLLTVTLPAVVYNVSSGPKVVIGLSGWSLKLGFDLVSYFEVSIVPSNGAAFVGINLFAALWLYHLLWGRASSSEN